MSMSALSLGSAVRFSALALCSLTACAPAATQPGSMPASASERTAGVSWIATAHAASPAHAAGAGLDPAQGSDIGWVFEAFLSPHQEPDEEENTPATTPKVFRSTGKSMNRAAREAAGHRGHGRIRFTKDLSRAFVDVRIDGIPANTVNMFHIHCGKPGILGPSSSTSRRPPTSKKTSPMAFFPSRFATSTSPRRSSMGTVWSAP